MTTSGTASPLSLPYESAWCGRVWPSSQERATISAGGMPGGAWLLACAAPFATLGLSGSAPARCAHTHRQRLGGADGTGQRRQQQTEASWRCSDSTTSGRLGQRRRRTAGDGVCDERSRAEQLPGTRAARAARSRGFRPAWTKHSARTGGRKDGPRVRACVRACGRAGTSRPPVPSKWPANKTCCKCMCPLAICDATSSAERSERCGVTPEGRPVASERIRGGSPIGSRDEPWLRSRGNVLERCKPAGATALTRGGSVRGGSLYAGGGSVAVGASGEAAAGSAVDSAPACDGSSTFFIHDGHSRASGLSKARLRLPGDAIGGRKRGETILGFCCRCFFGVEDGVPRLTGVSRAASTSCSSAANRAVLVTVDASAMELLAAACERRFVRKSVSD